MVRKAIIYVRVSTDEQRENGFSLQEQENRLRKYCQKENIEIVAIYREDCSAKNFNRPEYRKMESELKSNKLKADLFLCVRMDRFSRNAFESLKKIMELKKFGVEFKPLEMDYDLSVPENLIPFFINLVMPQVDNERRGINTKRGMRQAMREGRWIAQAPKGYKLERIDEKSYLVQDENARFVIEAFTEFSKGIYSVNELRLMLNEKGFSCSKTQFHELLRNPVYIGKIRIKAWKDEEEEIVNGAHEGIILEDVFYKVQSILEGRRPRKKPKSKYVDEFPLRGHLQCSKCGRKLTGSPSRSKTGARHFYYHCRNDCKERFRADEANAEFLRYIKSFKIRPEILSLYFKILEDVFDRDEMSKDKEIQKLKNQMKSFEDKIITVEDKFINNDIYKQDYNTIKHRYEENIRELKIKISELEMQDSNYMKYVEYSFSLLGDLEGYYKKADVEVKDKIVSSIFPEKLIYEEKKYRTPKVNEVLSLLTKNINELGEIKNKKAVKNDSFSALASPRGVEPLLQDRKS
ncbi:MAG: recombinase family protein [Candidatus Zhuqueibacterota bacterium]